MARKTSSDPKSFPWLAALWLAARFALAAVLLVGAMFGLNRAERFVITDARFALPAPDFGPESPNLAIEGAHYVPRAEIARLFTNDFGRSLYLLPLEVRRDQLLRFDWIKDASVARLWPNRVSVHIAEREPAAYAQYPAGGSTRIALLDQEGVFLTIPRGVKFRLPVVSGVAPDDPPSQRREKARRLSLVMKDLGEHGDLVSEMDVSDRTNIRVTMKLRDRAVLLRLGDRDFGQRVARYVKHAADIEQRAPGATTFDLTREDKVIAIGGE